MKMKWIIFIAVLFPATLEAKRFNSTHKFNCDVSDRRRLDRAVAALSNYADGAIFPENARELQKFCNDSSIVMRESLVFINKCYEKSVQDTAKIASYTVRAEFRKICEKKFKMATIFEVTPCLNRIKDKNSEGCVLEYIRKIEKLILSDNDKLKFPHACCSHQKTLACVDKYLEDRTTCMRSIKKTDQDAMLDRARTLYLIRYFIPYSNNLNNIFCGDYTLDSDRCETLKPVVVSAKQSLRYSTLFFPLIDLLNSIKG